MRRLVVAFSIAVAAAAAFIACGSGNGPTQPSNGGGGGTVNTPPTITSMTASTARVEVGSPVTLTAAVTDAETPVSQLTYAWSAPNGTISGTGAVVTWTPGVDAVTPGDFEVKLTVTENYTNGSGQAQNVATGSISVHVNNSPKELADMSLRFLTNFANSSVPPETCVSEFSDSCSGKKDELSDIADNRHDFLILNSTLRATRVDLASSLTSATVHTFCAFTSRVITTEPHSGGCLSSPDACPYNSVQSVQGDCYTTNVYESGRWRLCQSHFTPSGAMTAFARGFFGVKSIP